jgi:hypothetical protein
MELLYHLEDDHAIRAYPEALLRGSIETGGEDGEDG